MQHYRGSIKNRISAWVLGITLGLAISSQCVGQDQPSTSSANLQKPQQPSVPDQSAPLTLTLLDVLQRARENDPQFLSVIAAENLAAQDRVQARALLLPSAAMRSDYLNTQGNGVFPSGRYVTNDGVHVYREWGVFHQDLSPTTLTRVAYRRAIANQSIARAKAEIARRGLIVTVTRAYYALLIAKRKYAAAQQAFEDAKHFLTVGQQLEQGGEVAHSDVIKFEIQSEAQERALREATLAMDAARLDLAVLLFHQFDQHFDIVDDMHLAGPLPPLADIKAMAERANPALRAAFEAVHGANLDVTIARQAYLPSLTVDVDYGIEANAVALRSRVAANPAAGRVPNLGYFLTATLTLPVWDWGARQSKVRQAEIKRDQAKVELSAAQRQIVRNLYGFYQEAETARDEIKSLRHSADLAAESLRLNTLRYQVGEATVLEVVDAQNTLTLSRNAYDDGEMRYRVALANLQTLTGNF